ncbi:MAG: two-component system response regulator, partial [Nitrospiraceae bacterium]
KALELGQFLIHYQPKMDIPSGQITGAEAVVRWQHPERGMVSPVEFISIAQEAGLISAIDEWVLRTACVQTKKWAAAHSSELHVAINVSNSLFRGKSFGHTVIKPFEMPAWPPITSSWN